MFYFLVIVYKLKKILYKWILIAYLFDIMADFELFPDIDYYVDEMLFLDYDQSEDRSEQQSEDQSEDQSEQQSEDQSEQQSEDQSEQQLEDQSEQQSEDRSEQQSEDQSEQQLDDIFQTNKRNYDS